MFNPPTREQLAGDDHWVVRVPVTFRISNRRHFPYGKWQAYVPGPTNVVPWLHDRIAATGVDAMPTDGVYPLRQSLHLVTSLTGS